MGLWCISGNWHGESIPVCPNARLYDIGRGDPARVSPINARYQSTAYRFRKVGQKQAVGLVQKSGVVIAVGPMFSAQSGDVEYEERI